MNVVVVIFDAAALVAFGSTLVTGGLSYIRNRRMSVVPAVLILAAMSIMTFVALSNLLESTGVSQAVDQVEDLAEILVFPLIGYALYALNVSGQMDRVRTANNALQAEHAMLMNIVDTSPVGIVVVDDIGNATFANHFAWELLELSESDGPQCCLSAGVVVPSRAAVPESRAVFDISLVGRKVENEAWDYVSPHGRIPLQVSSTPLKDRDGRVLGSVVVFLPLAGRGALNALGQDSQ